MTIAAIAARYNSIDSHSSGDGRHAPGRRRQNVAAALRVVHRQSVPVFAEERR
jgi:hypothetical protein